MEKVYVPCHLFTLLSISETIYLFFFQKVSLKLLLFKNMMCGIFFLQDAQHKRCYDITGKTLEAGHVFTRYIKCLKDSMFQNVESVFQGIRDDDIEYVLTVPAIFGKNSKMFLREASVKVRMFILDLHLIFFICNKLIMSLKYSYFLPSLLINKVCS